MITNQSAFDRTRPVRPQQNVSRRALLAASVTGVTSASLYGGLPAIAARQKDDSPNQRQSLSLPLYPYGQPTFLDPHRATNWGLHWILLPHVWAGLLRFDENGAVTTDLAMSIEPEQEGQTWVAELRSDIAFASGNPITAQALIDCWTNALDPQHLAPMAEFMARVEGFDAFIAGESQEIGFEARSETTIAIHLTEPYAHFPEDLATFVWAAVDVAALEGVPGSEVPYADAGAGLWRFVASEDASVIRMVPNPNSPDGLPNTFTEVHWRIVSGAQSAQSAFDLFQDNELAIADIPLSLKELAQQSAELAAQLHTVRLSGSTMMIGMDFNQVPFDDLRVRQAVAASIDRDTWATEIQGDSFTGATSITPPVLSETANYAAPEPLPFDPEKARTLLAEAGVDESSQPPVTYYLRADAAQTEREQAVELLTMIQDNSGLVIELDTTLTAEQIEAMRSDNGGLQFDLRWWWPFTNSPSGLTGLASPDSDDMAGWFNWSADLEDEDAAAAAELFTSLTDEAATMMEKTERVQTYAEAEKLLIDYAVYIPLGHGVQTYVQSASLTGTRQGAFTGYAPARLDSEVVFDPVEATPTT